MASRIGGYLCAPLGYRRFCSRAALRTSTAPTPLDIYLGVYQRAGMSGAVEQVYKNLLCVRRGCVSASCSPVHLYTYSQWTTLPHTSFQTPKRRWRRSVGRILGMNTGKLTYPSCCRCGAHNARSKNTGNSSALRRRRCAGLTYVLKAPSERRVTRWRVWKGLPDVLTSRYSWRLPTTSLTAAERTRPRRATT